AVTAASFCAGTPLAQFRHHNSDLLRDILHAGPDPEKARGLWLNDGTHAAVTGACLLRGDGGTLRPRRRKLEPYYNTIHGVPLRILHAHNKLCHTGEACRRQGAEGLQTNAVVRRVEREHIAGRYGWPRECRRTRHTAPSKGEAEEDVT